MLVCSFSSVSTSTCQCVLHAQRSDAPRASSAGLQIATGPSSSETKHLAGERQQPSVTHLRNQEDQACGRQRTGVTAGPSRGGENDVRTCELPHTARETAWGEASGAGSGPSLCLLPVGFAPNPRGQVRAACARCRQVLPEDTARSPWELTGQRPCSSEAVRAAAGVIRDRGRRVQQVSRFRERITQGWVC